MLPLFSRISDLLLLADRFDRAGRSACETGDASVLVANGLSFIVKLKSSHRACADTSAAANTKLSVNCNWHVKLSSLILHADYNIAEKAVQCLKMKAIYADDGKDFWKIRAKTNMHFIGFSPFETMQRV